FSTTRTNSMRNEIFLGKITFDGMLNPILSCADDSYTICAPLSQYYQGPTTGPVRDTITLEGTPYFDKISISKPKTLTMGDEGAIAGENTRQVIGVAYSVDNTGVGSA